MNFCGFEDLDAAKRRKGEAADCPLAGEEVRSAGEAPPADGSERQSPRQAEAPSPAPEPPPENGGSSAGVAPLGSNEVQFRPRQLSKAASKLEGASEFRGPFCVGTAHRPHASIRPGNPS